MQDISLETAIGVLSHHLPPMQKEEVTLLNLLGRVAAEDIRSIIDTPPFDRSPLDGYALISADTTAATKEAPVRLKVVGEECAGAFYDQAVEPGTCVRIMTGGAMPAGTDCVVRQEDVELCEENGEEILLPVKLAHHENYCFCGEDVKKGTLLLQKGRRIRSGDIAVLAGQGLSRALVWKKPRIALASTGDELLLPGEPLAPGKIYNSNLYQFATRLMELGFAPEILGILPDDAQKAAKVLEKADCDVVLTTGGVSVGKKDIMHQVVPLMGAERLFWRVLMKPGAPAIGYKMKDGRLGIALSGNPFAAYATFELIARPTLRALEGCAHRMLLRRRAVLTDAFPKESRGRRFIRARYDDGRVALPEQHASGTIFSAASCNAFLDIPAGSGVLNPGDTAEAILLRERYD